MADAVNLYAPPKARVEDVVPFSDEAHAIRKAHIKTEASIRSIGTLYYLGTGLMALGALVLLSAVFTGRSSIPFQGFLAIGLLAGCVFFFFVARGLRHLRSWARTATVILSALTLFGGLLTPAHVPMGGIVTIYILYLLLCKKGRRIFQSDYPDIIAATPDVKNTTSVVVWFFLALLVVVILLVGVAVMPAGLMRLK